MRSQKLRRRPDTCHAFHPEVPQDNIGGREGRKGRTQLGFTTDMPVSMHTHPLLHPCVVHLACPSLCLDPDAAQEASQQEDGHTGDTWEGLQLGWQRIARFLQGGDLLEEPLFL